jgi:hypothetical protein
MWHIRGRRENHTGFWCGNLKDRTHLEGLGVDLEIILKWKEIGFEGVDLISSDSGEGQVMGCYGHGNEHVVL